VAHVDLMKHYSRGNDKDLQNNTEYNEKLDQLFNIIHAASNQSICTEEDEQLSKLLKESKTGSTDSIGKQKANKDKRSMKRKLKHAERVQRERQTVANITTGDEMRQMQLLKTMKFSKKKKTKEYATIT
jgi:hypothetical protein